MWFLFNIFTLVINARVINVFRKVSDMEILVKAQKASLSNKTRVFLA